MIWLKLLGALACVALGGGLAWLWFWWGQRDQKAEAVAERDEAFHVAEQELWMRYEQRMRLARDLYTADLARLQAYRDSGKKERAEQRFHERLRAERLAQARLSRNGET